MKENYNDIPVTAEKPKELNNGLSIEIVLIDISGSTEFVVNDKTKLEIMIASSKDLLKRIGGKSSANSAFTKMSFL